MSPRASASSPIPPSPGTGKVYRCTFPECSKSFSRAEHLNRHSGNHDGGKGELVCRRCDTVFKRKDLLERHMVRHKQKDDEAGGEGLGTLQTRKRLWKDLTGVVVAGPRPEHSKRQKATGPRRSLPVDEGADVETTYFAPHPLALLPTSPPSSADRNLSLSESAAENLAQFQHQQPPEEDLWLPSGQGRQLPEVANTEAFDFLLNAHWGSQLEEIAVDPLLYGELFVPDTASSFNNPFTTASYYNWLFDDQGSHSANIDPAISSMPSSTLTSAQQSTPSSTPGVMSISDLTSQGYQQSSPAGELSSQFAPRASSGSLDSQSPETSAANQILALSQNAQASVAASLGYRDNAQLERTVMDWSLSMLPQKKSSGVQAHAVSMMIPPRKLPLVNEAAREGILEFVDRAQPKALDGSDITRDHHLLSLLAMQDFCNLFFTRFHVSYPLLHQATFQPAQIDPLLFLSVLLLGATYSDKEAHLFSICVHDTMRAQILNHTDFTTRPALWMLQTILLVECFGKSRAGQLQHDMSHLFHGLLINLIRRSDCQSARCQPQVEKGSNLNRHWLAQIDAEQRRRLALLCFMWDTQHAVLFSQSLCMNAAELKLTLPWNDNLWEAETAEEFYAFNSQEKPQPTYLSALKTYISSSPQTPIPSLNALSQVLMLHGLMSVAWDLNRRDQTSMSLSIPTKSPWQTVLSRAYENWHTSFLHSTSTHLNTLVISSHPTTTLQKFIVANLAIYRAAHIALHVEINDLQIFAGATHIIGRPVTALDRERSKRRIQTWVHGEGGVEALVHAAHILRDGMTKLHAWDAGDVFHYPWTLYLATLTVWAFQVCCQDPAGAVETEGEEWDARAEMMALVSAMTRSGLEGREMRGVVSKFRTGDLPRVMSAVLSGVRWAVVQEGVIVLRGLGRLSVQR